MPDYRMNLRDYQRWVATKWGVPVDASIERHMCAAGLGLAGEAGEVADLVKKQHFHSHPADPVKLRKEMGDVLFYLAAMCNACGDSLQTVMEANVEKLNERYPNGFEASRSINKKAD